MSIERRTSQEWFKELPRDIEKLALENTPIENLDIESTNLLSAILVSFTWADTPQGYEFWRNIKAVINK